MDDGFRLLGFAANLASLNALETRCNVGSGGGFCTDTTLRLESPGTSSKGTKRKWGDINLTQGPERPSLALGLGHSSSSSDSHKTSSATACTMSSVKETDEECSMDLGLSFQLHLGKDNTPSPNNPAVHTPKTLNTAPELDLELSLSLGPSESAITSITEASVQHQSSLEASVVISQGPTIEDLTISSRWKNGSYLLPYLNTLEIPATANPVQNPDLSSTKISTPKSPVACTSRVVIQQKQRSTGTKNCNFPGCVKGARGASGLCIAHGGGRRCQKAGCHKGAEGKTIYCKAHGGGRRCQYLGCTKSAEGRTEFCIAHGGGRRCSHEGCTRAARGKSGLCIRHGGGKRCQKENCTKSAEDYSGLCIAHGGGRRCQYPACTKGAQGSTMLCKAHGGGKRCTFPECKKGAEGSTPFCKGHGGGKRCSFQGGCPKSVHGGTQFCVAHGGGKRCAAPECTKSARGRTNFCVRHGGGKRCKFDRCGKSAQGSTDFCKAHGGGRRCSWGQLGSGFGAGGPPCDRFARGKIGLCATHGALVQDHRVHGGTMLGPIATTQCLTNGKPVKMKGVVVEEDLFLDQKKFCYYPMFPPQPSLDSLPEGRVHGGSLMAMLGSSNADLGSHSGSQVEDGNSHESILYNPMAHRCV